MTENALLKRLVEVIEGTEVMKNNSTNISRLRPWIYSVSSLVAKIFGEQSKEFELINNELNSIKFPMTGIPENLALAAEEVGSNFERRNTMTSVGYYLKSFKRCLWSPIQVIQEGKHTL